MKQIRGEKRRLGGFAANLASGKKEKKGPRVLRGKDHP